MPKLLDRYIFSQLLPPFFISLGALCFVMLTKELLRLVELLVTQGVGFLAVLKVFLYLMPSFLVLTLPIAGIIGSITVFGRLSYDKEVVALNAAGVSLLRLSLPVVLFSSIVFALTLVLSQWGQPWTNVSLKKLAISVLRDQLTISLEKGVFNEPVSKMVVYVADRNQQHDGGHGIFISDERNSSERRLIVATDYQVINVPQHNQVALRLNQGTIHSQPYELDQYQQVVFSTYDLKLNLDPHLYAPMQERPSRETLLKKLEETNWKDTDTRRRLMESYKDLAFPIAAFLFGMLGVPVGIVSKRSGRVGGFAVGILIVIAYYIFNVLCDFLVVTRMATPFAGAWLPNIIFLAIGLMLYVRMNRQ